MKFISTLIFSAFLLLTGTVAWADTEPDNNVYSTADVMAENDMVTGALGVGDAQDWYKLVTTSDGVVTLTCDFTGGAGQFIYFRLYDSDGTTHLPGGGTDYDYTGTGATAHFISQLAAGTYYVNVLMGFAGTYTLTNTVTTPVQANDTEPNNTPATATILSMDETVTGHIKYRSNGGVFDTHDYYQITTTEDGTVTLTFEFAAGAGDFTYFYLYDSDGTTFLPSGDTEYDYGTPGATVTTISGLAAGTYYISIDDGNVAGGYTISASVVTDGISNDVEPNGTPGTAVLMELNENIEGHIKYRLNGGTLDTDDYYEFTTTEDGDIAITFEYIGTGANYAYFYLYDNDGTTFLDGPAVNYDYATPGSATEIISGLAAGTYILRVNDGSVAGGYILSATVITDGMANDTEPNNVIAEAIPMATNSSVEGHIRYRMNGGSLDADDYYEIVLSSSGSFTTSLEIQNMNPGHYAYYYLYNSVGSFIDGAGTNYDYGDGGPTGETFASLAAGTYYLRVDDGSIATGYTLTNTFCPDAITIVAQGETTFCDGESVTLSTPDHHDSYLWSDGSVTETNVVTLTGEHSLTIDNGGGCVRTSNTITTESTPLPVAIIDADGPTEFCEGGDVTLSVAIIADTYTWSNGETTPTITVSETGDYSVLLQKNSCSALSDPIHIEVNSNPVAEITPDGSTDFCEGGSVMLTATSAASYAWSNGETTESISADASGDFYVTITDANGCSGTSSTITITENPYPVADISADGPTEFCTGESVDLTASGGATYLWSNGAVSAMITVTTSGDYSCTVTNAEGCSATTDIISVTVTPCGSVSILAEGPTEFCEGGSVTLTSSEAEGNVWSTGETTQSIVVMESGDYYCENAGNTSNIISVTVTENPDATITPGGPVEFCDGGSVMLSAIEGYDGYLWSTGSMSSSIEVTESGSYSVEVSENGCSATSSTIDVIVTTAPTVSISSPTTTLCYGASIELTAAADAATYQWQRNGVDIDGAISSTHTTNLNGLYTCIASNGSCSTTSNSIKLKYANRPATTPSGTAALCGPSVMISVDPVAGATYQWYRNATLLAGATSNSYAATMTGNYHCLITKAGCTRASEKLVVNTDCRMMGTDASFEVSPNPAAEQFTVNYHLSASGTVSLMVIGIDGRLVMNETTVSEAGDHIVQFNTEQMASGVYLVCLITPDGQRIEQKLVIEK